MFLQVRPFTFTYGLVLLHPCMVTLLKIKNCSFVFLYFNNFKLIKVLLIFVKKISSNVGVTCKNAQNLLKKGALKWNLIWKWPNHYLQRCQNISSTFSRKGSFLVSSRKAKIIHNLSMICLQGCSFKTKLVL